MYDELSFKFVIILILIILLLCIIFSLYLMLFDYLVRPVIISDTESESDYEYKDNYIIDIDNLS